MLFAVTVILWCLAAVLIVLAVALLTPVLIEVKLQKDTGWHVVAAVRLFGGIGPLMPLSTLKKEPGKMPKKKKKSRKKRRSRSRNFPGMLRAGSRLVQDIMHQIKLRSLSLDARFGLGDPAQTGQVFGQLTPLMFGTTRCSKVHFNVEPVFDEAVLTGRAELVLSVIPAALLPPAVRFGWHMFRPVR